MNKLWLQLFKFGLVGAFCFVLDFLLLVALTEYGGVNYLLSSAISFSVSVVVNYEISMHAVFRSREDLDKWKEFFLFVVLSIGGLGLTELLMWLLVEKGGLFYALSKVVVTILVMGYNFITRKLLLEERNAK